MKKILNKNNLLAVAIAGTTTLLLSQLALAGIETGNSDNPGIPYYGFKKNPVLLAAAKSEAPIRLNKNSLEISLGLKMSDRLKSNAIKSFSAYDIMRWFSFPTDVDDLAELYRKAVHKEGDFNSFNNPGNPFGPFLDSYMGKNVLNLGNQLKDPKSEGNISMDQIYALPENTSLSININVNKEYKESGCSHCEWSDLKPLPIDGINLEIYCRVGSMPSFKVTEFNIRSQIEEINLDLPILDAAKADGIRRAFCGDIKKKAQETSIECWAGIPEDAKPKFNEVFNYRLSPLASISLPIKILNLEGKNPKHIFGWEHTLMDVTARDIDAVPFKIDQSRTRGSFFGASFFEGREIYDIGFAESMLGSGAYLYSPTNSEADFVDYVRRAFIASYEKTIETKLLEQN